MTTTITEVADNLAADLEARDYDIDRQHAANSLSEYLAVYHYDEARDVERFCTVRVSDHDTLWGPRDGGEWVSVRTDRAPVNTDKVLAEIEQALKASER